MESVYKHNYELPCYTFINCFLLAYFNACQKNGRFKIKINRSDRNTLLLEICFLFLRTNASSLVIYVVFVPLDKLASYILLYKYIHNSLT